MKRPLVIGLLAAVVAAAVYLLVLRDDGDAAAPTDTPAGELASSRPARQTPAPARVVRDRAPIGDRTADVVVGGHDPTVDQPMVYEREDGSVVRDHRKNPGEWIRPALPHRSMSPVDGKVSAAVMAQVRPVVLGCLANLPADAYGPMPVVMTRAQIAIDESGTLTVAELGPALSDIDPAAAAAALECIRAAAPTLRTTVDHAAVASATLAFPIRPLDYRR